MEGNIIIMKMICFFSNDKLIEKMWEGCKNVIEVVKLEVFWNILKEFINEIDVNIDLGKDYFDEYLGIVLFFEESDVEIDNIIEKSLYKGCNILKYLLVIF